MNGATKEAASLASLSTAAKAPKRGKRGTADARRIEKDAAPAVAGRASPYLVTCVREEGEGRGGGSEQGAGGTIIPWRGVDVVPALLDPEAVTALIPPGVIVVSASLTTPEQTSDALHRAWRASSSHALAAALYLETKEAGEEPHLHGPMLFASDERAALFDDAWRSAAGGSDKACCLKELGAAAFARTGEKARPTWEKGRALAGHIASVLHYPTKHGPPSLFALTGVFASLSTAPAKPRQCACGCGKSLAGRKRGHVQFFDGACRRRYSRAKRAASPPCLASDAIAKARPDASGWVEPPGYPFEDEPVDAGQTYEADRSSTSGATTPAAGPPSLGSSAHAGVVAPADEHASPSTAPEVGPPTPLSALVHGRGPAVVGPTPGGEPDPPGAIGRGLVERCLALAALAKEEGR